MVTFNLKSSKIGKVGTLASVAYGTNSVIDVEDTIIEEMKEGVVERDQTPAKTLATLLKELGIQGDKEKIEAFQDIVNSLKEAPVKSENELKERVRKSKIFGLLENTERVLGLLSSAATVGTTLTDILPLSL